MPIIKLHPPDTKSTSHGHNALPQVLHTPSGLALLEMQATIHTPAISGNINSYEPAEASAAAAATTTIGNLVFPLWNPQTSASEDTAWMKRVYLYVGKHQRLTGEVKKLPKAIAVVARKPTGKETDDGTDLVIREIVRYKIVFSSRPEPVGEEMGT